MSISEIQSLLKISTYLQTAQAAEAYYVQFILRSTIILTMSPLSQLLCFDTKNPDLEKRLPHGTDVARARKQNVNKATYCYEAILTDTEQWSRGFHTQWAVISPTPFYQSY
jgi:hypothetical protein